MAGAILGKSDLISELYDDYLKHTGPAPSPFNAWVILKGLETLELRVKAASASAARIADALAEHPAVNAIRYPHRSDHPHYAIHAKQMSEGGTLIALSIKGGQDNAFKFLNNLRIADISNNLGDSKTLACHPSTTTHRSLTEEQQAQMGLDASWIRLSVGLEDVTDLESDLLNALNGL